MLTPYRSRLLASTLFVSAAMAANPAFAQTADPASQPKTGVQSTDPAAPAAGVSSQDSAPPAAPDSTGEIVVTGTLIRNPNLVSSSPVAVIGQEEINLRQRNTAEEILRDLPGAVPSVGSAVNNGNGGAAYADLRGLGNFRNVVLLDGTRITPSNTIGRVDLNNIPLALVERVDTLTGGAATTYGADAVSGVINFITRSDFQGIELNVSEQITEQGDGGTTRADLTIGGNFADDKGNAVISIGYQKAKPIYQGDRNFSVNNYTSTSGNLGGSGTTVPSRFTLSGLAPAGSPTRVAGNRQINPTTGALGPVTNFNFNPYNIFQTPFERFNIYGAGHYDVADGVEFYTRGLFSKNNVKTIIAPSGIFGSVLAIPFSNPYLPAPARQTFCANNPTFTSAGVQVAQLTVAQCNAAAAATNPADPNFRYFTVATNRRTTEVGPRVSSYTTTIFDYRAGFKVDITDSINLDVGGSYGESENRQSIQNYVLTSRARAAAYATNTATCLPNAPNGAASITAGTGCVPINLFGPDGSITGQQVSYLTATSTSTNRTSLAQARALLTGDLGVTSPFADDSVNFAVGAEYRKYRAGQDSDTLAQTPGELGGAGGAAPTFKGGYQVYEGYGELIAPLVVDRPGFKSLTIEGGIRYSDYKVFADGSPSYNTTTYKGAATYEPFDGLKFRGNYQRAVRAPNIAELFSPVTTGLTTLSVDACAGAAPTTNANLRAVCLAQGAPVASIGSIQVPTASQAAATSGGNLALRPEKADSYTFGVVIQPEDFVPGLSITVDYYHIKIRDAISQPTAAGAYNRCFGNAAGAGITAASATDPACTIIRRNPATGALDGDPATTAGLFLAASNQGRILTDGIDLGANYRRDLGFAKLNLSFQGNWTHRSIFTAEPGGTTFSCVGLYGPNCGSPGSAGPSSTPGSLQPKFSWNQRTTLTFGSADISLLWRHINKMTAEVVVDGDPTTNAFVGTIGGGTLTGKSVNFGRIKAFNYLDFATRVGVSDNLDVTFTVQNMFDKKPPIVGSTIGTTQFNSGNTYPSTYDALGRRFAVGARVKF